MTTHGRRASARALGLSAVLGTAGVMHFVRPEFFDEIVPHKLPFPPRVWTYVSGLAELACAAAVARPATRKVGGLASAFVFVAVFPANIQMAVDWRERPARDRAAVARRGAVAIDYRTEDFLARVRALPGHGVDVALAQDRAAAIDEEARALVGIGDQHLADDHPLPGLQFYFKRHERLRCRIMAQLR